MGEVQAERMSQVSPLDRGAGLVHGCEEVVVDRGLEFRNHHLGRTGWVVAPGCLEFDDFHRPTHELQLIDHTHDPLAAALSKHGNFSRKACLEEVGQRHDGVD